MINISIQQGRFLLNNSFLVPNFSFRGVCSLALVQRLQQNQRIKRGFSKNMAWSMDNGDLGLEVKIGVVHLATDAYAAEAVEALKAGKVIAVPTDTLYGFACDACSLEAVNRIYEIKGRKHTSPLAICVGDVSDIDRFAVTDHLPHGLLDALLPGPVTVVLRRGESSALERSLNPEFDSIGVRVPDCNFIRLIARGSGTALALTSANLSGQPSSVCIKDFEKLWEHCASVYDGGTLPSGRAGSTVVDLTTPYKYKILRPGSAKEETVAILEKHSFVETALS
ncbi:DHBP synthase RibB alpha/beta domain-containing protein [Trifolium repens]|nr:DHBP synthase RibB alpha/beta domain-containing protein [Trifolium repens]